MGEVRFGKGSMLQFLCIGLIVNVFAGCVKADSPTGLATFASNDFFPLKIGYTWYYGSYWHDNPLDTSWVFHTAEVVGVREINQRLSYMVVQRYFQEGSDSTRDADTSYYIVEGDSLLSAYRDSIGYRFTVDAIFSLNKGEKFTSAVGMGSTPAEYQVTVTEKNDSTMTFFFDEPRWVDEEHQVTYKRGAGIVDRFSNAWGVGEHLIRARL